MKEYVLVYARPVGAFTNDVLVVLKNKPEWQAGRFNLTGGKIEAGEKPVDAAVRELKEETGLVPASNPTVMGTIKGSWGIIYCVKVPIFEKELSPDPEETEVVAWAEWSELKHHPLLIPNLRVVIPLMMSNLEHWVVYDEGPEWGDSHHEIKVKILCDGEDGVK